jgi:metal-responsive CopG/Arc/MetJ family transcriptional regulator
MDKQETVQISIRLPQKLLEEIESLAHEERRTRNNMITDLLYRGLPDPATRHDTTG